MFVTARARVYDDNTGASTQMLIVLTPAGVLLPLLHYFRLHAQDRSLSWQTKVAQGLMLFLDYLQANEQERNPQLLFMHFAQRLQTGTFDERTATDPSGLCWKSRDPGVVRRITHNLTEFFTWLKANRPLDEQINPTYVGNAYDRMVDNLAYQYRRDAHMLGYSWSPTSLRATSGAPMVRAPRAPKVASKQPPAFPEDKLEALLCKGFLHGNRKDYRGACITLLLHGAGFRECEPFHLYVQDVFPDPADRLAYRVHIHHPEFGEAPSDVALGQVRGAELNRASLLRLHYGLEPRNRVAGSLHAGWKNPLLDEKYYMRATWFTPQYGRWFKELWDEYLMQIVGISRPHPWAFVNLDREPIGSPYTVDKFQRAHAAACERTGLQAAKALGTTPHGHRHAFGQRLKEGGLDPAYIRLFMHHKSVESQRTYTRPTIEQTQKALHAGLSLLSTKRATPDSSLLLQGQRHSELLPQLLNQR
jgi:hypothetical protein